jgi:adenosylhomocysteine nucleosidase
MNNPKIIITFALESEFINIQIPGCEVINVITGVGKSLSAASLMRAVFEHKPIAVLNVGIAGTLKHQVEDIIVARHFVDRDLMELPLDGILSSIQNNYPLPRAIQGIYPKDIEVQQSIVNTGDKFLSDLSDVVGDAVDMEAFAQAVVCKQMQTPFISVKYITDVIGQNSLKVWEDKLTDARQGLSRFFEKHLNPQKS